MKHRFMISVTLLAALILLCMAILHFLPDNQAEINAAENGVLIVFHPAYLKKAPPILNAYESVLQEEGVQFKRISIFKLIEFSAGSVAERIPILILPDGVLQSTPEHFSEWSKQYLDRGGNIAIIYDVGIRHPKGFYLDRSTLADIAGLNYITYDDAKEDAFTYGYLKFSSKSSRDLFQFPYGKTMDQLMVSSYGYGRLRYPMARNKFVRAVPDQDIHAYGVTVANEVIPAIVLTNYANGKVLYVNLPLGHLKANTDDLPLRATLRTFLFDVVGIPHLMNVARGLGGIVINWHVDSNSEYVHIPQMYKEGYLRRNIPASFHITAGDYRDDIGDGIGFDAAGNGKHLTLLLKDYGAIGSHGGWAHNWFSENITNGVFGEEEIRDAIVRNNECLEKIVGYKITEYAAPNGAHPQPTTTRILEDLGMSAYYYTGDTGSAPNRTFFEGEMVSEHVIAFPIMPYWRSASLWEMQALDKREESEVTEWFSSILRYVCANKTVRLFYSHPYDIKDYPNAVRSFLNQIESMQAEKRLKVWTMDEYAGYLRRFLQTTYSFQTESNGLTITMENPVSLTDITIALPKGEYRMPDESDLLVEEDERYYYLTVVEPNVQKKHLKVSLH
jgi:peptidoglycan/xylan/chitin deacetylase (PgdA/CDA1 family)